MAQTIGSGGGPATGAEAELATKTPPGAKVGTPPKPKTVKMETAEQTTPIEVPKTTEERVIDLENRLTDSVNVINNLIAFCNTIERWRTLPFKTDEQVQADQAKETATSEAPEEVDETTSE